MFHEIFRTKERKAVGAVLGLAVIVAVGMIIRGSTKGVQFVEQAVMAENYLNAGSYEQAVGAYQKALDIKDSDKEALTVGLAQAYAGLNNYEKALEVLRSAYEKLKSEKIKNEIEKVKAAKTDYEFLQSISRADVYYSNEAYDKAITEYGKAKLIKSKEPAPYQGIAKSYMMQEKYELAREQILEGIEVTQSTELEATLASIDTCILKEQYDEKLTQAKEYIYQENYKDGIAAYQEAIDLLPAEAAAYEALAQLYIEQGNYHKAVELLKGALLQTGGGSLEELLDTATQLLEEKQRMKNILSSLSAALADGDAESIAAVLDTKEYQEKIAVDVPVYYGVGEGDMIQGRGMVIYSAVMVYYGDYIGGMRNGTGICFIRTGNEDGRGYYYYDGKWIDDIPSGEGEAVEVRRLQGTDGKTYEDKTVTIGSFYNNAASGAMEQYHYEDGAEMEHKTWQTGDNKEEIQGLKDFIQDE